MSSSGAPSGKVNLRTDQDSNPWLTGTEENLMTNSANMAPKRALARGWGCFVYALLLPIQQAVTARAPRNRADGGHNMSLCSAARVGTGRPLNSEQNQAAHKLVTQRCKDNVSLFTTLNSITHLNGFRAPWRGAWPRLNHCFYGRGWAGTSWGPSDQQSPCFPPCTSSDFQPAAPGATSTFHRVPSRPLPKLTCWVGCAKFNGQFMSPHLRLLVIQIVKVEGSGLYFNVTVVWTMESTQGRV